MRHAQFKGKVTFIIPGTGKCSGRAIKTARWAIIPLKFKKLKGKLWNLHRDIGVGRDAIERAANSSLWDWDAGSTLFFWRWPCRCCLSVRDGLKHYVDKDILPFFMKRQQWPQDPVQCVELEEKIKKVRSRGYV